MTTTRHGTQTAYRHGCRCEDCKRAVVDKDRRRRERWTPEQREARKARGRAYYASNKDAFLKRAREKRYGITDELFQQIVREQRGLCAICKRAFTDTPHLDHDHITGMPRGVLCSGCNTGLGLFKDDEDRLVEAILYLRRSRQS